MGSGDLDINTLVVRVFELHAVLPKASSQSVTVLCFTIVQSVTRPTRSVTSFEILFLFPFSNTRAPLYQICAQSGRCRM